jgi:RHS repeat-associated protein/uncharacterized repeat protein (TIGR01451 family)
MSGLIPLQIAAAATATDLTASAAAANAPLTFLAPQPMPPTQSVYSPPPMDVSSAAATPSLAPLTNAPNAGISPAEGWTVSSHWKSNGDGTMTGEFYPQPQFRYVGGAWLPIDPTVTSLVSGAATSPGSLVPLTFGVDTAHVAALTLPSGPVTESYGSTAAIQPSVSGQTITYPGIARSTDLRLTVQNSGVKEELVLRDANAPTSFTFHLSDPSSALGDVTTSGPDSYRFTNAVAPDTFLDLPRPFAYPDGVSPAVTGAVPGAAHQSVTKAGDGYDVTLAVDPAWLQTQAFPVDLDPSMTWGGNSNNPMTVLEYLRHSPADGGCGADGGNCLGSTPKSTEPNGLGAGTQTEKVGGTYVADGRPARAYYYFGISSILPNSAINSADFYLYMGGCLGYSQYNCDKHDYTEQFYPTTAKMTASQSTFDDFDAATGPVLQEATINSYLPGTRVQKDFNLGPLLRYWVGNDPDGYANPNDGIGQKLSSEPSDPSVNIGGPSFAGPNDTTDPHPKVVVDWTPPPDQMSAPVLHNVTSSDSSLKATYSAPADGGPAIDSYRIKLFKVGASTVTDSQICNVTSSDPCTSVTFTGLAYDDYYVVAQAHNSAGYGATSPHSNDITLSPAPNVQKTVLTSPGLGGVYERGQQITYKVAITNPISTPMTVDSVTDNLPSGMDVVGSDPTLTKSGIIYSCLRNATVATCTVNGNTISTGTLRVPGATSAGPGEVDLKYNVIVDGRERGCEILTNAASAVNAYGTGTDSVPITVCDSGLGIEPWWSYFSRVLGPQSTLRVNPMNGNAVVQATDDTTVPARGHLDYVLRRTYNSQDTQALTLPGSIGAGWLLNVGAADDIAGAGVTPMALSVPSAVNNSVTTPLSVTLIDRDGTRHVFTYRSTTATAAVNLSSPIDVSNITTGSPVALLRPVNPALLPKDLNPSSAYFKVCVDSTYQPPSGVHLALWRYIGLTESSGYSGPTPTCSMSQNPPSGLTSQVIGWGTVRPDRFAETFDATGHLLDMIDGSGVDLRYLWNSAGRLTSVYEPVTDPTTGVPCTGAPTLGCRAMTFAYPSGTEIDVTDPAGRLTKYLLDSAVPQHLIEVVNPPETQFGSTDHTTYTYQGVAGASCGGSPGQLCTVATTGPRTQRGSSTLQVSTLTTHITYSAATLGPAQVASVDDRRIATEADPTTGATTAVPATTFTYVDGGSNPDYVTADTSTHRIRYYNIDFAGRVREIDEGNTSDTYLHETLYTWDTASSPCSYASGSLTGSNTPWQRRENELCEVDHVNSGSPDQDTLYTYTPEGAELSERQVLGSSNLYTTYGYHTQYERAGGNAPLVVNDTVSGTGDVTIGNRTAAIGDGTSTNAGDPSVLYALTDRTAMLPPRGNAASATVSNFRTDYTVANNSNATPDVTTTASCGSQNSGLVCQVSAPYNNAHKAVTTYAYNSDGERTSATVPDSADDTGSYPHPADQTTNYTYQYYSGTGDNLGCDTGSPSNCTSTRGWLEGITDPSGHFVVFGYDRAGNAARTWDRNATASASSPDTFLQAPSTRYAEVLHGTSVSAVPWRYVLSERDPAGNTTQYTVDTDGNRAQITDARGYVTKQWFDADDNLLVRITPAEPNNPANFFYNKFGYITWAQTPNGAYTVNTYDTVGRLTATYTDRGSASTTAQPTACDNSSTTPRPPIPSGEIVCHTLTTYDMTDDVIASQDGEGQTTTYAYDGAGRPTSATTPRDATTSYTGYTTYDEDGNVVASCPPRQATEGTTTGCPTNGHYSTYHTYTTSDHLASTTTYRDAPTTTHGTVANPPVPSGALTTTYSYDDDGNLVTTTDPLLHTTTDTYDYLDRKTSETTYRTAGRPETTSYRYDPAGNTTAVISPGSQPLGDSSGTPLNIDGAQYPRSNPYVLPAGTSNYPSVTLTNGGWIVEPVNNGARVVNLVVAGAVKICSTCGIVFDGAGSLGGTPSPAANKPGTAGGGTGAGGGGGYGATSGGGGGGAGYGAGGALGSTSTGGGTAGAAGITFGSSEFPDGGTSSDVGSGGGGGGSTPLASGGWGGAGGGFLHITADAINIDGTITANGNSGTVGVTKTGQTGGSGGGGSGGSIWLTAPQVTGLGTLSVAGGAGAGSGGTAGGNGGAGRIRLDTDFFNLSNQNYNPPPANMAQHTLGRITAYSYDADNRLYDTVRGSTSVDASMAGAASNDGGSNVRTRLTYDKDGNLQAKYEPRAFSSSGTNADSRFETYFNHDQDDRLTDVYLPYADSNSSNYNDALGGPAGTANGPQCSDAASLGIADYSNLSGVRVCHVHYSYDADSNRTDVQLPTYTSSATNRYYHYGYTPDDLVLNESIPDPRQASASGTGRVIEHSYTYDGTGRVIRDEQLTAQDPATVTSYTSDGLVASVTYPANPVAHSVTYGYDANGNQTSISQTLSGSTSRISYTNYYSDDTVYDAVDTGGNTTSYNYDAVGNTTAVYSPDGNSGAAANPTNIPTKYTYYQDNLLKTTSTPTNAAGAQFRLSSYSYDAAGRKTSVDADFTNSSGTVTTNGPAQAFSYYPDDLLQQVTGRGGETESYTYDPSGDMTSGSDNPGGSQPTVTTTASYYLNGEPRQVSEAGRQTVFSYDGAGQEAVRQDTTPAGAITTTTAYSNNEQPISATGGATNGTIAFTYDDQQRPSTIAYPNGDTAQRTWNPDGTLASQVVTNSGSSISSWYYGYDGMYRITAADNNNTSTDCSTSTGVTPVVGLQCYSYGLAGRLTKFRDWGQVSPATYDADGNRLTYGPTGNATTWTYNPDDSAASSQAAGQLTATSYQYTQPFGGITDDGCSNYTYDGFGRLTQVSPSTRGTCTNNVSYAYDILDRQSSRTDSSGNTTTFGYDGLDQSLTSETKPASTTRYTVAPTPDNSTNAYGVSTTTGTQQYMLDDGQGNITATATTSGSLNCDVRYDPWGSRLVAAAGADCTSGATPSSLFYRSSHADATTGDYQFGSRTYNPAVGDFLTPDSYTRAPSEADLGVGTDPLTRNTYTYVNGDPLNLSDPTGHMSCGEDAIGSTICDGSATQLAGVLQVRDDTYHRQAAASLSAARRAQAIAKTEDPNGGGVVRIPPMPANYNFCTQPEVIPDATGGQIGIEYCVSVKQGQALTFQLGDQTLSAGTPEFTLEKAKTGKTLSLSQGGVLSGLSLAMHENPHFMRGDSVSDQSGRLAGAQMTASIDGRQLKLPGGASFDYGMEITPEPDGASVTARASATATVLQGGFDVDLQTDLTYERSLRAGGGLDEANTRRILGGTLIFGGLAATVVFARSVIPPLLEATP